MWKNIYNFMTTYCQARCITEIRNTDRNVDDNSVIFLFIISWLIQVLKVGITEEN